MRSFHQAAKALALFIVLVTSGAFRPITTDAGHFTNWINVFAPFYGTWNPSDISTPGGWAPPESHHTPWGGNWAIDYYKPGGNTGYLLVSNSNSGAGYGYMYSGATQGSCLNPMYYAGLSYKIQLYDDYSNRGWLLFAHVDPTDSGGDPYQVPEQQALSTETFIGRTRFWSQSDCYDVSNSAGVHWHVEMSQPTHNACYSYAYTTDLALTTSDALGAVGSNATWTPPYCGGP